MSVDARAAMCRSAPRCRGRRRASSARSTWRGSAGVPDVISLDMGGTSADVALIRNYTARHDVRQMDRGLSGAAAVVDINAVGAGGGSIAWFDRDGLLKVGPQSAGAEPGPGLLRPRRRRRRPSPTPTSCSAASSPRGLLGGGMALDAAARARARSRRSPSGSASRSSAPRTACSASWSPTWCARSARSRSSAATTRATSRCCRSAAPGRCTRRDVARASASRACLVPLAPGILCAQGLIVSDLRETFVRTARRLPTRSERALRRSRRGSASCTAQARRWFERGGRRPAGAARSSSCSTCAMSARTSSLPIGARRRRAAARRRRARAALLRRARARLRLPQPADPSRS